MLRFYTAAAAVLKLSTTATQTFVRGSGHFMQRDYPQVIVETIAQAVVHS